MDLRGWCYWVAVGALDVCTEIERVIELISDERTEMERKKNNKKSHQPVQTVGA